MPDTQNIGSIPIMPMITSPDLCIVKLSQGERIPESLATLLDPADMGSLHEYVLPAGTEVELHYHDFDEYWLFREGTPSITLNLPDGASKTYQLNPGDLVATLRGVAHTLHADHVLRYYQWNGEIRPGTRSGHLLR
ncbi:MAG: hypothetical protein HOH43_08480 [Candidatus Latescibacteria bacterium]|nr:hypothetical protein [Candidatus Latescibacterota bacterium]